MKRRVSRAHTNKRNLRLLSATHGLTQGSYNVLCDSSFLRASLLSYWQHYGSSYKAQQQQQHQGVQGEHNNSNSYNSNSSKASGSRFPSSSHGAATAHTKVSVSHYVKSLLSDAFGNAAADDDNAAAAAAPASTARRGGTQLRYCYLPETGATLRRMMSQPQDQVPQHQQPRQQQGFDRNHQHNQKKAPKVMIPKATVNDLLSAMDRVGGAAASAAPAVAVSDRAESKAQEKKNITGNSSSSGEMRNEAKAIADYVQSCSDQHRHLYHHHQQATVEKVKRNAHLVFVATQSHDVRRLLPKDAALLRLALKPDCVWIEHKASAFHYDNDKQHSQQHHHHPKQQVSGGLSSSSPLAAAAAGSGAKLSAADIAFMKYLGKGAHLKSPDRLSPAGITTTGNSGTAETKEGEEKGTRGGTTATTAATGVTSLVEKAGQKRARSRGKKQHNPNPLSVKKKSKREVFRVDG